MTLPDFSAISGLAVIVAVIVSFATHRQLRRQTKGAVLLGCLESYNRVAYRRERAIRRNDERSARLYFRELLDLTWTEYRMWRAGLIDYNVMYVWLYSRHKAYEGESIVIKIDNGEDIEVYYKYVWENLKSINYFNSRDDFSSFMDEIHDGHVERALKKSRVKTW